MTRVIHSPFESIYRISETLYYLPKKAGLLVKISLRLFQEINNELVYIVLLWLSYLIILMF